MDACVMGIDQSTQGTKLLLFDAEGNIIYKADKAHKQYIDEKGWVEHDPDEIWQNIKTLVKEMLEKMHSEGHEIRAIGISNQRETAMAWNRKTGRPIYHAIVWQCARGAAICEKLRQQGGGGCGKKSYRSAAFPIFFRSKACLDSAEC